MHLDDSERDALAGIEASLADTDPDFSRMLRRSQRFLRPRLPSWPTIAASGLLLVASAAVLVAYLRLGEPLLLIATGVLIALAGVPVTVSVRRCRDEPRYRRRRPLMRSYAPGSRSEHGHAGYAVVVATDGMPESDGALRFAAGEAALRRIDLVVVITYRRTVDPDRNNAETPNGELRTRALRRADAALRPTGNWC